MQCTSSQTRLLRTPGRRFMILSSTELRVPSDRNDTASFPNPPPKETFLKYLQKQFQHLSARKNGVNLQLSRRRSQKLLPVKGLAQVPAGLLLLPPAWLPSQDLTMTAAPSYVATQVGNEVVGILVALVADEGLDSLGKHFHGDGDLNRRGKKNPI